MKTRLSILALLAALAAGSAAAQDNTTTAPQPDYSQPALQRFVASIPEEPKVDRNIHFVLGGVEFRALGTNWRLAYIPIFMPLSGSRPGEWPDPFELTGTQIATSPRAWRTQRRISAELRRIEKMERAKIRVKAR